ncbi:hypothetical protein FLONG3_1081 [Fusarium longipes]|uniref:Uncharacterized protein n=1 Tax=Fusarium longipes TaxID=694270 RepID=A0A395T7V5_9HYPO|nr:hypothetical protein FLONG3_1081 [Fusarium longipes]
MAVSDSGLTCEDIGKVESKASSFGGNGCSNGGHWELSYRGVYSGTASSRWTSRWTGDSTKHNRITLLDNYCSPGTNICGSKAACSGTEVDWDAKTTPDIYFVFRPEQIEFNSWSAGVEEAIREAVLEDSGKTADNIKVYVDNESLDSNSPETLPELKA